MGAFGRSRTVTVGALLALAAAIAACGPMGAPQSCGAGGTADEGAFAKSFSSMELVNEGTGQAAPETDPQNGPIFATADRLAIRAGALAGVSVRTCVEGRTGGAQIGFDRTQTLAAGAGTMSLGAFGAGPWVVRVEVDGVLVKNLPFRTR